jgi:hypothetical protein
VNSTWVNLTSGLLGAIIGGALALLGVWMQHRAQIASARRILLRRARSELERTLLSGLARWTSDGAPARYGDGTYTTHPGELAGIQLVHDPSVDIAPLPRDVLERIYEVNAGILALNERRSRKVDGHVSAMVTPEIEETFRLATALRADIEQLASGITKRLGESNSRVARGSVRLVRRDR